MKYYLSLLRASGRHFHATNGVACVDEFITESICRGPSKLYGTRFRYSTNHRDGYGTAASGVSVI